MAPLTSVIVENYGYGVLATVILITTLCSLALTIFQDDVKNMQSTPIRLRDLIDLVKTPDYVVLVVVFALINVVFNTDNFTVIDKMIDLDATYSQIGLKWSIQALIELPLLFAGGWLLVKFNMVKLLRVTIVFFALRIVLNALAVEPNQMLVVALLQGITFPLLFLVQKFMIDQITTPKLRSSVQMIGLAIFGAFPAFITPLISGFMVDRFGFNFTLLLFGSSLLFGYLLTHRLTQFHSK